ncbi:pepsin-like aspartic protease [Rhodotorula paludigena]|uniref:pepsin-like aspartic protease n=1 Tax=Rhodotorula paludigena TaxID=86838 RepID=UPI00316CAA16
MPTPQLALSFAALALAATSAAASPLAARRSPAPASLGARSAAAEPQVLKVPIRKRSGEQHRRRDGEAYRLRASAMRNKYGGVSPSQFKSSSSSNSTAGKKRQNSLEMTSYQDSQWYGEIDVGTPPTAFSVVLDTGSSDLILAETGCNGCLSSTVEYDPNTSSTSSISQSSFSITYGSGAASGSLVSDTISIANYTQDNQIFAACDVMQNIVDGTISGILGLGWTPLAQSRATPLVQDLWESGALPEGVFGFAFETHTFTTASEPTAPGGTLTIGGVDTSAYSGEINWVNVVGTPSYWNIPLEGVSVGGRALSLTDDAVVIDTGTTLIGMPESAAQTVYDQVPNSTPYTLSGEDGYWAFPCEQTINVTMTFGGVEYPIDPEQFNAGSVDSRGRYCLGAIFALETTSTISIIVGDAFLTGVYNAYRFTDPPAVGFAQLGSGGSANTGSDSASRTGGNGAAGVKQAGGLAGGAVALAATVAALVFA